MGCTIQKLTPADISLAKQFIAQLHIENGEENAADPSDTYIAKLLSADTFHGFVAVDNGKVAGGLSAYELPMLSKEENEMFLYDIEVTEPYRKQGIATALIDALKATCRAKNIHIIFVGTSTDSTPAIKLYEATGGTMELIPWFTYDLKNETAIHPVSQ